MQPTEALQKTIELAETAHQRDNDIGGEIDTDDQEAIRICKTFMDAAVPIARFRCYVTIEGLSPNMRSKMGLGDFTICGLTISAIKNGLLALRMEKVNARILLWELFQEKADMISGYQGDTKTLQYRNWLADIDRHEAERDPPPVIGSINVQDAGVPRRG